MGILSLRAKEGLRDYKYKPGGYTILDVIHEPFWVWCVNRLPLWLAPNLITLIGLGFVIASYLIMAYHMPDFQGEAPSWVYFFAGFAVVVYVNLDCLDGKQARRTRSSSPLGQLFDHGCDALSVNLLLACIQGSLGSPCDPVASVMQTLIFVPFLLAHLEEYHTGSLLYGNGFFGVLEANYTLAIVHFLTWALGPKFWWAELGQYVPAVKAYDSSIYLPWRGPELKPLVMRDVLFVAIVVFGGWNILDQFRRVIKFDPAGIPHAERGHKELGRGVQLKHLAYLTVMLLLGVAWISDVPTASLQCRAAESAFGFVYALVSSQLIMFHMAKEPFTPSLWGYVLLAVGALNSRLHLLPPLYTTLALWVVAAAGYLHYTLTVIREVCDFLGIKALTIKKVQP